MFGLPTQDVGMEYFAGVFDAPFGDVLIVDQDLLVVAVVPAEIEGQRPSPPPAWCPRAGASR